MLFFLYFFNHQTTFLKRFSHVTDIWNIDYNAHVKPIVLLVVL